MHGLRGPGCMGGGGRDAWAEEICRQVGGGGARGEGVHTHLVA